MSASAPLPDSTTESASWLDALLLGGILLVMLYGLGGYGLYEPHEGHFAGVGREMLLTGNWVVPHLNGAPYLNKPPLLYWLIASSYALFGISEFSARLPLALSGWCAVVLAWQWVRELRGIRAARMAALCLASSCGWYLFTHQLLIDALLATLYLAALYCYARALRRPELRGGWIAFYSCASLSVFAKGPIGLGLLAAAIVPYVCFDRSRAPRHLWIGVLILLLVMLPWTLAMESRIPGYLHYTLVNENLNRAIDQRWPPDYDVSKTSFFGFLFIACVWLAPWSLLIPHLCAWLRRTLVSDSADEPRAWGRSELFLLMLAAIGPTALFLPMPSRLIYYCVPSVPTFAMLAGIWLAAAETQKISVTLRVLGGLLVALGLGMLVGASFVPDLLRTVRDLAVVPAVIAWVDDVMIVLGIACALAGSLFFSGRPAWGAALLALILLGTEAGSVAGFAEFDPNRASRRLAAALDGKVGKDCIWIHEGSKEIGSPGGLSFYLGQQADGTPRWVYVMADDPRRPPPAFPGPRAKYLIDREQMQKIWDGAEPALFVTDFARKDFLADPPRLPKNRYAVPVPGSGWRLVYANAAAWKRLFGDAANNPVR